MTLVDEIDALLVYPRQIASDVRVLLTRAAAALRAPTLARCPHGCGGGTETKFGLSGPERHRCLACDSRWLP